MLTVTTSYTITNANGDIFAVRQTAAGAWQMIVNGEEIATAPAARGAEIVTRAKLEALRLEREAIDEAAIGGLGGAGDADRLAAIDRQADAIARDYLASLPSWRS